MRRNKCFYVFLTVGALLSLLSSSCLTAPATQPSVTTPASPVAQLQTDVATVKTDIATLKTDKASAGSITALETRMAQAEGNIRTLQSTSPANTYTKAEVDAAVAKAIADLKTAAPWGTSSSGSSSGSTPATNQIVVRLYNMIPNTIYGSANYTIFVEVKNGYTDAKKIILTATLTPSETNVRVSGSDNATTFSSDSQYIWGTGKKMATSVSAGDCVNFTSLILGTTNQILIGGNTTIVIPVKFDLWYCSGSPPTIWSLAWTATIIL